ncbi:N-ethylmaleimide reductase [Roseiarcus fermentans]|uniref:N-ethylmaleimide reductase n=1 Tax=Roseiarcus fermentans TaxID=1473586 RepID=A0A366FN40_9HYPH|nr:alkene reductase [Roseiarcus fermentans]RBP16114.1 N-ethylmaleimide reductase [Roseiarcus fermentans]
MSLDSSPLLAPFRLGDLELKNRVVMAPLTRNRATPGTDAPRELNARYYVQRASAGLLVSEGSQVSREGQGYLWTPGVYTEAQVEGWRKVTGAVHAAGGRIFIQLWHVGRVSHVSLQEGGKAPVAPSAIIARTKTFIEGGFAETSMPRALETEEVKRVVADFGRAAANAKAAGFDGVEIHGANGYLVDQFLRDGSNKREDIYGGSIENRIRFALEVVDAIARVWPSSRIGIRMAPVSPANDIADSNPQALFGALVEKLSERKIGYIHVVEGQIQGPRDYASFDYAALRRAFSGAYIANNGYDRDSAIEAVRDGRADLVAFGRWFISNPDLVERLRRGAELNAFDRATFYGGGEAGYTDYPTFAAAVEPA